MKNFTNNFKQFTSRLSARWLIMALMMLVGTSSAWAAIYLKGSFNGWGTSNTFDGNGNCTITLSKGNYTFKIDDGGTWYGNGESITRSNCLNVSIGGPNGSDMKLDVDVTGSYKFYWNGYDKKLTVTYPQACTQCCDKVEIKHPWNGGSWTYKTLLCDNNNYSIEAKYGDDGCNWKINGGTETWIEKSKLNIEGSLVKGDDCIFSFNTSNNTITITKVVKCETLTAPTLTVTNVKKCNTDYTDGKITISGYDANTYTYELKNSSNQTVNKTYNNNGYTFTKDEVGTYKVIMKRKDNTQCEPVTTSETTISITDNTPAIGDFKVEASSTTVCSGTQITLTATHINGASYEWFLNNSQTPISGATSYQYKPTITADAIYKVVVTKTSNSCPTSKNASVSVTKIPVPTQSDFDITLPNNPTYDGTAKNATVTPKNGITGMGDVNISYYKGVQKTDPINAGEYTVKISVDAGDSYCAMTETEIGTFTINCKAPTEVDFVYTGATVTYDGNAQAQTVTWANNNDKGGAITVWYKSGSEYTQTAPTNAGVYTVAVTSDAAGNYCEAKQKIEKKETLTIQCAEATKTQYPFEPVSFEYDGIAHTPTITPATGAGKITKTVYKKDNEIVENPTEVGEYTIYVTSEKGTGYCAVTDLEVGSFTITCDKPVNPTLTKTDVERCNGEVKTYGTITITNIDQYQSNYKFYLGGSEVTPTEGVLGGIDFPGKDSEIYTVKVTNTCGATTLESDPVQITLTAEDITPVVGTLTLQEDFEACDGKGISLALTDWNPETGFTYNYIWEKSADGNTYSNFTGTNSANVTTQLSGTTWYRVKVTKTGNGCTSPEATSNAVKVTALPVSKAAVSITAASYDMYSKKFSVTGVLNHVGCSQDVYVGYSYKLIGTDTWSDLINISRLTGDDAVNGAVFSKNDITISNIAAGQKYLFQTYAINGHPDYLESSAVLSSSTIEVEVQDGYTVYVRRPKNGEDIYTKWYELSSVKGGLSYVKSGAISGTGNNDNQATTNNTDGTEMSYAFTDCDGYTWDSFKPAEGQTKFYIHALNDDAQNGWATFSQTATITSGQDNYFILSSWNNQYGVPITSTNQPTRGVRIKALGSTEVISNNMASFAAISFAGNCTGKELPTDKDGVPTNCFQWKYYDPGTSTWSNYDGVGATWNNIRPTKAGKYKLICTMKDMTTVESNEVTITTTSRNYEDGDLINIESNLPIIMVNTGDNNGFPACSEAGNDYPSKHADKFKKKLSVDVKIKVGENIVYDKKARMAYRGSSSLNFKKKSYAFCPGADMCGVDEDKTSDFVDTKKMDMLSLITKGAKTSAKDKDWVLYAATPDPSMMRNILAMETFSAMTGNWGVKNQYVELYVDGEYQGVYVFMDKITQNKDRVDITWNVDGSSKEFIVKFDKTDYADRYEIPNGDQKTFESAMKTGNTGVISYGTEIDQRFEIEYPEKDKVIKEGGSWADVYTFVKGKIDAFESALKDGDFNTVRTIIDYESWADFFILTEFAKNGDGFRASCVFVYEDGLLRAYPLWDYELSFNNETRQEHGIQNTTGLLVKETSYSKVSGNGGTFPAPFWWTGNYYNQKTYKGLLDDPCFIAMVKARWTKHTTGDGALTKTKMKELVDDYNEALTTTDATGTYNSPQQREAHKWPYNGTTRGLTCNSKGIGYYGQGAGGASSKEVGYYKQNNVEGSLDQLNAWIGDTGRRVGLNKEIDDLAKDIKFAITVVADKTTTTPWRPVTVTVNSNSGYEYSITPEPAKLEENGHIYTLYFARPERTEGQNFTTVEDAYTFTATTGQADQCGTTQGTTTSAEVKIDLADVVENCQQP